MAVLSVCLSPGFQRSVQIDALTLGEVNRLRGVEVDIGGKGVDVCRVLQRLGVDARCVAQGGDNADEMLALAAREALNLELVPSSGRLRTCTTIVEMAVVGGRRVTELVEPASPVDAACVDRMSAIIRNALRAAPALVIAGSMAPGFPAGYQARLAEWARRGGIPVLADLQGAALREVVAAGAALVKINLAEFAASFLDGRFAGGEQQGVLAAPVLASEVLEAVQDVSLRHPATFVLTRGPNSILLLREGEIRICPVTPLPASEILSPIGSGDAFLAALLAGLLAAGTPMDSAPALDAVESAIGLAVACAQSNARTLRPGFLEESFAVGAGKIPTLPSSSSKD